MSDQDDNFFSRWSRRKVQVRQGVPPPAGTAVVLPFPTPAAPASPPRAEPVAAERPTALASVTPAASAQTPSEPSAQSATQASTAPAAPPRPTLEDVEVLTPESDYSRFLARDVDTEVKNLAMKKLFTDPHFNVMDGLDIYIGDYNTPDPLPKSVLRQLVQARMLGLLDDEMPEQPAAQAAAGDAADVSATPVEAVDAAPAADDGSAPDAEALPDAADNGAPDAALPARPVDTAHGEVRQDDALQGEALQLDRRLGPAAQDPAPRVSAAAGGDAPPAS